MYWRDRRVTPVHIGRRVGEARRQTHQKLDLTWLISRWDGPVFDHDRDHPCLLSQLIGEAEPFEVLLFSRAEHQPQD
jgi:hypothetical protein